MRDRTGGLNMAHNLATALETMLTHFGDKLSAEDRAGKEKTLQAAKDWLKSNGIEI